MGYLTGKVTSSKFDLVADLRASAAFPRFTSKAIRSNWVIVDLLRRVGQRKRATPAQMALAWLHGRKQWIVPIPGTTNLDHLRENLGAADVELTAGDMQEIEYGFAKIHVEGARAPEALLRLGDLGANLGTSSASGHGLSPLPR